MTGVGPESSGAYAWALSPRTYRHLDRTSKLLGVGLVALGLDVGGDTLVGVSLGVVGAALALTTVFVRRHGTDE